MLAVSAVSIYIEGLKQQETDASAWIYTAEKVSGKMGLILPVLIAALVFTIIGLVLGIKDPGRYKSIKTNRKTEREVNAVKGAVCLDAIADPKDEEVLHLQPADQSVCELKKGEEQAVVKKRARLRWLRLVVFAVAAALIVIGILNGSTRDVLMKAIMICSECIGLD